MKKGLLAALGLSAALKTSELLGSIGGSPKMGEIRNRDIAIGGVGKKKKRRKTIGSRGHRRVAITGKPWIPSLDLRRIDAKAYPVWKLGGKA